MDKSKKRELLDAIEEDIQILSDTLGNFSRLSIYNPHRKEWIDATKKDIQFMLTLRTKINSDPE